MLVCLSYGSTSHLKRDCEITLYRINGNPLIEHVPSYSSGSESEDESNGSTVAESGMDTNTDEEFTTANSKRVCYSQAKSQSPQCSCLVKGKCLLVCSTAEQVIMLSIIDNVWLI